MTMSNTPPQQERAPVTRQPPRRQLTVPGAQKQRRTGLLVLGAVLVVGAGFGSWFVFQSLDERAEYLMAARTIQRWERVGPADFTVVEANVGAASALTPDQVNSVRGYWATGRIPAGTMITAGLFEEPPLASDSDADRVLIEVSLPSSEAPFGELKAGDTIALLGADGGAEGLQGPLGLIGVLTLEFIQGDSVYYVVTPEEALTIKDTIDRFTASNDRTILKMGPNLTAEDIVAALPSQRARLDAVPLESLPSDGSDLELVEEQ